jgi:hypothetical protein
VHAFRFDTDGDGHENVSFKVRFANAADGSDVHGQHFTVHHATRPEASSGIDRELIVDGSANEAASRSDIRCFAGVAADLFAGDGTAPESFEAAFADGRYTPEAFSSGANLFRSRQVAAIVLEVSTPLIGDGDVRVWATVSLWGHAPETQVARWGWPLVTHLLIRDDEMREAYNRTPPWVDKSTS